jgi:hypothetical protein
MDKENREFNEPIPRLDSGSGTESDDDDKHNRAGGGEAIKVINTIETDHAEFLLTNPDGDEVLYQAKETQSPK